MPKAQAASNVAADKKMMVRRAVAVSIFLIGGGG